MIFDLTLQREIEGLLREVSLYGPLQGNGPKTKMAEDLMRQLLGCSFLHLTNSCTGSLEMACQLFRIRGRKGTILIPSFTHPSTANAPLLAGFSIRYCDIDLKTLNLSVETIKASYDDDVCGIIFVHYAGLPAPIDKISKFTKKHGLFLIEDAAQAFGSTVHKQAVGSFGDLGCFSFHGTKDVMAGEGGAITAQDPGLIDGIRIMREFGTNRYQFFQGKIKRYEWVQVGGSYLTSELSAALLIPQLKRFQLLHRRKAITGHHIYEALKSYKDSIYMIDYDAMSHGGYETNWHFLPILVHPDWRDRCIKDLVKLGVPASTHFVPLHTSSFGKQFIQSRQILNMTEKIAQSLIRIPINPYEKESDIVQITKKIQAVCVDAKTFSIF